MDVLKIAKFAHVFRTAADGERIDYPPGGADGNLATNWADDGKDSNDDIDSYSDEELNDRFKELLDMYKKKTQSEDLDITPDSDKIPEITRDMERMFFGFEGSDDDNAKDGPCWSGYEMVGMKDKGGRRVPNCVPKS